MRHLSVVFVLSVGLLAGWGLVASRGLATETEPGRQMMIALDLMDLEIPGEGSGDEMELPPIKGVEKSDLEPEPTTPTREPPEPEWSRPETPEVNRSVHSSEPGLVPFLLEDPGVGGGSTRPGAVTTGDLAPEAPTGEFPAELKTVSPPPSRDERLKLPSGMDTGDSGGSDVPEVPLLTSEDPGQRVPMGQDSSLTMKPLPDLRGTSGASRDVRPSPKDRRPENYLQVREDLDAKLIDIYERYYKDR
jgi:hypothetical protein